MATDFGIGPKNRFALFRSDVSLYLRIRFTLKTATQFSGPML